MEKIYDDLDKLVGDIKLYVKTNPKAKIIENDDVANLAIKYEDASSNNSWKISVDDLHKWLKTWPDDKANLIRRAFQTTEGKPAFLNIMFKQNRGDVLL